MSSVRYRCSSFSPFTCSFARAAAQARVPQSSTRTRYWTGLPLNSAIDSAIHNTYTYATPGYRLLTTHRKRRLMSRVTHDSLSPSRDLALRSRSHSMMRGGVRFPDMYSMHGLWGERVNEAIYRRVYSELCVTAVSHHLCFADPAHPPSRLREAQCRRL
jgi:hypothetical protein